MKTKCVYAGSFDPVHLGHIDIMRRASEAFGLTVLIANNPAKKYMFTLEERKKMVCKAVRPSVTGGFTADVATLNDPNKLTADFAFENNIPTIIRGVRSFSDYDTEAMIRDVNISQQSGIETYFLKCDQALSHISSGAVKELFNHAGFIHEYVPLWVKREMERKAGLHIIGITGNIASGKNWVCERLIQELPGVFHLDMDKLAHFILFQSTLPVHQQTREKIRREFDIFTFVSRELMTDPLTPEERVTLGNMVFADADKRVKLNAIMGQPILTALRRMLSGKQGVVLLNAALLVEFNLAHICNNQVVLVTTDSDTRQTRLKGRGLNKDQIKHRLASQFTDDRKKFHLEQLIKKDHFGKIIEVDTSNNADNTAQLWKAIMTELHIPVV